MVDEWWSKGHTRNFSRFRMVGIDEWWSEDCFKACNRLKSMGYFSVVFASMKLIYPVIPWSGFNLVPAM